MKHMRLTVFTLPVALLAIYAWTRTPSPVRQDAGKNHYVTQTPSQPLANQKAIQKANQIDGSSSSIDSNVNEPPAAAAPNASPRREVSLATIRELSDKVFLSPTDKTDLKRSLLAPATIEKLQAALHDPELLNANKFSERIKYLDAVYEGLKFKDPSVQTVYTAIATKFLLSEPPSSVKRDKKLQEQFFGDRVELALMMRTIDNDFAKSFEQNLTAEGPKTKSYFKQAEVMASVYQVSL